MTDKPLLYLIAYAPVLMDHDDNARDIAAAAPGILPKVAGVAMMMAGFVSASVALQVELTFNVRGFFNFILLGLGVSGAGFLYLGTQVLRAREWAAIAGVAGGIALTLLNAGWVYESFTTGYYSLLALMALGFTLASTVISGLSIPECARASEARKNLKDAGLDLGL